MKPLCRNSGRSKQTRKFVLTALVATLWCVFAFADDDKESETKPPKEFIANVSEENRMERFPMKETEVEYVLNEETNSKLGRFVGVFRRGEGASNFKLVYNLSKGKKEGRWNLAIQVMTGDRTNIRYAVLMNGNAEVLRETIIVEEDSKENPSDSKKEKRVGEKRSSKREERLEVSIEDQSFLGQPTDRAKVLRYSKNGESETEFNLSVEDWVATFFQMPVFASNFKNIPAKGVPVRCTYSGQPHPVLLTIDQSTGNLLVSRSDNVATGEDVRKPLFEFVYGERKEFSLPTEIRFELDGNPVSLIQKTKEHSK